MMKKIRFPIFSRIVEVSWVQMMRHFSRMFENVLMMLLLMQISYYSYLSMTRSLILMNILWRSFADPKSQLSSSQIKQTIQNEDLEAYNLLSWSWWCCADECGPESRIFYFKTKVASELKKWIWISWGFSQWWWTPQARDHWSAKCREIFTGECSLRWDAIDCEGYARDNWRCHRYDYQVPGPRDMPHRYRRNTTCREDWICQYRAVECYASRRIYRENSDVVAVVIDAFDGITHQDEHIVWVAIEAKKWIILVLNKWDKVLAKPGINTDTILDRYMVYLSKKFDFLSYAPVVFSSAIEWRRIDLILEHAPKVQVVATKRVKTWVFNKFLEQITYDHAPTGSRTS